MPGLLPQGLTAVMQYVQWRSIVHLYMRVNVWHHEKSLNKKNYICRVLVWFTAGVAPRLAITCMVITYAAIPCVIVSRVVIPCVHF